MSEYTFDWISISDALASGLEDMLVLHWEEVALDRDQIPLAVDWPKYQQLERLGVLRSLGCRRGNRFVGYNVFFVQPTLHYSTSLWAVNDILYLDPDERFGLTGARLIKQAEPRFKDLGVKKIIYHAKLTSTGSRLANGKAPATVGKLLSKLGYVLEEERYAKLL